MRNRKLAVLTVCVLALAACGGSDGDSESSVPDSEPESSTAPVATDAPIATEATTTTTTVPMVFDGATVVVANGNISGGSAGRMSDVLGGAGFTMGDPVTASVKIDDSVVYFTAVAGAEPVAETLGLILGGVSVEALPAPIPTESGTLDDAQVLLVLGNNETDKTLDELSGDGADTGDGVTAETSGSDVIVANASGVGGSAGAMSSALEGAGFAVGTPTNSDERIDASIVYYAPDAQADAEAIAAALGGVEALPLPDDVPTESGSLDGNVLVLLGADQAGKTLAELAG